ncbi:hypothetical protein [Acinetobacter beijerinckii]|uniref:hypothetical protein n=1 Tax=Acinetobacter beijerinckii TaxID=262668 RepID=UPI0030D890F9
MRPIQYTISAVDRATETIDRISNRVERLTQPFSRLGRSVQRLGDLTGVNKLAKGIGWLTSKMMSLLGIVLKLGAPLLALFGGGTIAGIYQMTEGWAKLGSVTERTAQIMGVSAQRLMNWRGVGDLVGIGAETMTQGLQGLQQTLQDAKWGRNQAVFGMLKQMGIGLGGISDKTIDTEKVLLQLADRIQQIQKKDPAAARHFADMLGVTELMPVLMNGSKAIKGYQAEVNRLQGDFNPATTKRAKEFADKLNGMKVASDGMKASIADKLIPVFQPLIEKWTEFLVLNRTQISDKIAKLAERLVNWLSKIDFDETLKGINKFIDGCVSIIKWTNRSIDKFKEWKGFFNAVGESFEIAVLGRFKLLYNLVSWTYDKLKLIVDSSKKLGSSITFSFPGSNLFKRGLSNIFGGEGVDKTVNNSPATRTENTVNNAGNSFSFDRFRKSIITQESSGNYGAVNPRTGALGFAQVMPQNLTGWGKNSGRKKHGWDFEALGYDISPKQFLSSPELQMKIINFKLKEAFDKYGAVGAARWWYSNNPNPSNRRPTPNEPSPNEYAEKVLERMQASSRGGGQDYLNKMVGSSSNNNAGDQSAPLNVSVNTIVHPNGGTTTKVATPQGVKISHNQPGDGYSA